MDILVMNLKRQENSENWQGQTTYPVEILNLIF